MGVGEREGRYQGAVEEGCAVAHCAGWEEGLAWMVGFLAVETWAVVWLFAFAGSLAIGREHRGERMRGWEEKRSVLE